MNMAGVVLFCLLLAGVHAASPRLFTNQSNFVIEVPLGSSVSITYIDPSGVRTSPDSVITMSQLQSALNQQQQLIQSLNSSLMAIVQSQSQQLVAQSSMLVLHDSTTSSGIASLVSSMTREFSRAAFLETSISSSIYGLSISSASSVNAETSRANSVELSLALNINAEIDRATTTELSLAVSSSNMASSLSSASSLERSRALSIEASIFSSLSLAVSQVFETDISFAVGITQDRSRAISVEASLSAASLLVSSSLATSIQSTALNLSSSVSLQASRAIFTEGSLSVALSLGVSRAISVESSLSTGAMQLSASVAGLSQGSVGLASEVSRAVSAEASLSKSLSNEVSRASSVEASLANSVAAEASRAVAAERLLNMSIPTYSGTCRDLKRSRQGAGSGLYDLLLPGWANEQKVYCDMTTLGGGWTLIGQSVATTSAQNDGSGGYRNLYNLRTGGGNYNLSPRGANNWAFPNAYTIAQKSTQMLIARWATPSAATGDISTADAAAYFALPDASVVTFSNPSYQLSQGSTALTGPCVAVNVTNLKGSTCLTGCTRYTFKFSIGTTWGDSYPTNVGVSVSSTCSNDVTGGPAIASDDSGSYNPSYVGYWGKTSVAGGSPYYWHQGLWDCSSTNYAGLGTVWLR